jgi:hypothetical protein
MQEIYRVSSRRDKPIEVADAHQQFCDEIEDRQAFLW